MENVLEIFQRKSKGLASDSTSLSDGDLVDGLPSARHTEAVGGPHGVFGPAPICNLDPWKSRFEGQCVGKLIRTTV